MSICWACFSVAKPRAPPKIVPAASVMMFRLPTDLSPDTSKNFLRILRAFVKDLKMCLLGLINFGNLAERAFCSSNACEIDLSIILVSADNTILNSDFSMRKFMLSDIFEFTIAVTRITRKVSRGILLSALKDSFKFVVAITVVE